MGGHGDDGDMLAGCLLAPANQRSCLQAAHDRHLQIHEQHIKCFCLQGFTGEFAVGRHGHAVAALLQQVHHELLVDGIVLGHQHVERAGGYTRRPRRAALVRDVVGRPR